MTGAHSGCILENVVHHKLSVEAHVQTGGDPRRALGQVKDSYYTFIPADTLWLRASAACESHCLNYTLPPSLHHYSRGDPRLLQSLWGLSASLFTPGRQHLCPVHIHIHPNFKVSKGKGHPTHPMRTPSPQPRCLFPPCALIIAGRPPPPFCRTGLCFCLQLPSSALALSCWCELSIFKVPS